MNIFKRLAAAWNARMISTPVLIIRDGQPWELKAELFDRNERLHAFVGYALTGEFQWYWHANSALAVSYVQDDEGRVPAEMLASFPVDSSRGFLPIGLATREKFVTDCMWRYDFPPMVGKLILVTAMAREQTAGELPFEQVINEMISFRDGKPSKAVAIITRFYEDYDCYIFLRGLDPKIEQRLLKILNRENLQIVPKWTYKDYRPSASFLDGWSWLSNEAILDAGELKVYHP